MSDKKYIKWHLEKDATYVLKECLSSSEEIDLYYINKEIHLNNISYLREWSTDKGKEHRKLVGNLIHHTNRLSPPLDCVRM